MSGVKSSKVVPLDSLKTNNFINDTGNIIINLKNLISLESFLGVNRIFLFQTNKIIQYMSYLYSAILLALTVYYINQEDVKTASYLVVKHALSAEYFMLIFNVLFSNKKKWVKFFHNLNSFDWMLNISRDIINMVSSRNGLLWFLVSSFYMTMEFVLLRMFIPVHVDFFQILPYLMSIAHDFEIIIFCTLLKLIHTRLCVLRAHVTKMFSVNEIPIKVEKLGKIEAFANKAQLDISTLHKAYDLLHKCSEQLNSLMSFQMVLLLFTSGLSTTMLLKNAVKIIQLTRVDNAESKATIVYVALRSIKYTICVVMPCNYSSIISKQVSYIRSALHDAVNSTKLEKIERRKIKAFFQLTRESEFTYALWGMIRLNMTLPLSYLSLCTTYLVIIIQFSKFID